MFELSAFDLLIETGLKPDVPQVAAVVAQAKLREARAELAAYLEDAEEMVVKAARGRLIMKSALGGR